MSLLQQNIAGAVRAFQALAELQPQLDRAAAMVSQCLTSGHKLLLCGNGGSAADAAHLATEFVCRYQHDRRPYPAIAFSDAGSTLAAIGNDYHFDQVFARQVHAFGQAGDVLIVLSTSGKSRNIRLALDEAKRRNIASIALLGRDGGECRKLATVDLIVKDDVTARIQEAHKLLYHTLCEMVEKELPQQ